VLANEDVIENGAAVEGGGTTRSPGSRNALRMELGSKVRSLVLHLTRWT